MLMQPDLFSLCHLTVWPIARASEKARETHAASEKVSEAAQFAYLVNLQANQSAAGLCVCGTELARASETIEDA